MIDKLEIILSKLANQNTLRALRRGLLFVMPFVLIGSTVVAFLNLPIPAYQSFMVELFGNKWRHIVLLVHKSTLNIMALLTLITVSNAVSHEKELVKSGEINSIFIVITALASFIAFISKSNIALSLSELGSAGMYKAIVISILTCNLYCFFYKLRCKIITSDIVSYNGSALISTSFKAIVPAFFTILLFILIKLLVNSFELSTVYTMLLQLIDRRLLTGQNPFYLVLIVIIVHVMWFFGIHGGNVVIGPLLEGIPLTDSVSQSSIKTFLDTYVFLGGAGATLGLLIVLIFGCKKNSENRLAKISIFPAILNINETIIFGLPIIYNPYLLIPFVLSPVTLTLTAWLSVQLGWLPAVMQSVEWTTPIFLSGYLSTHSISGVIVQAINLILSVLIYAPFIKIQQKNNLHSQILIYKKLLKEIQNNQFETKRIIINRHDDVGFLARSLMEEIKNCLKHNNQTLHLEYQPKVRYNGQVIGAEALLRWNHPVYGYISPLVIIRICSEATLANDLGQWIMNEALYELRGWHDKGYNELTLSINLNPEQLYDDKLVQNIQSIINQFNINSNLVEFELTENTAIDSSDSTKCRLKEIKDLGVNLAIDDFGMGHSSLLYICDFEVNIVKIDIGLVHAIYKDNQRKQIVKAIINLCSQINVNVVAEGVETEEQLQILHELGCEYFQGYYFSKSLTSENFIDFINVSKPREGLEIR